MKGQSLLPVFKDSEKKREKPLYWAWSKGKAMRKGNWKIVKLELDQDWELYNLKDDPTETHDLATEKPELTAELDSIYTKWHTQYYD